MCESETERVDAENGLSTARKRFHLPNEWTVTPFQIAQIPSSDCFTRTDAPPNRILSPPKTPHNPQHSSQRTIPNTQP